MRPHRIFMTVCIAVAASVLRSTVASAQSRADSADPEAQVPAATYRSPFADYRAFGDEPVGNWRAANDEVGRIGGWRAYAREAQAPGATPPASAAVPSKSPPGRNANGAHGAHRVPEGKP